MDDIASDDEDDDDAVYVPQEMNGLINEFRTRLQKIGRKKNIVIFVDSVHELSGAKDDRARLSWIPEVLPPNVRLVVSLANSDCLELLRNSISFEDNFLELGDFRSSDAKDLADRWSSGRRLTARQRQVVENCLDVCRLPLYVQLVLRESSGWNSAAKDDEARLEATVRSLVLMLLARIETECGETMARRALELLALARHGLTQNELEDLLSLDEVVMEEIHSLYRPPLRRVPPFLVLRFMHHLKRLIKKRQHAGGVYLWTYRHQVFKDVVMERFATQKNARTALHLALAEYFSNRWDLGDTRSKTASRALTAQPLYWDSDSEGQSQPSSLLRKRVYNGRRLDELPHQLMCARHVQKLKEFCFCNVEYLLSRMRHSPMGIRILLDDLQLAVTVHPEDGDLQLLLGALEVALPTLESNPQELVAQLTGRLQLILAADKPLTEKDPDSYPALKAMLRRARTSAAAAAAGHGRVDLIPSVTCLVPPSRSTFYRLSGHKGRITAVATSGDGLVAVTTSEDDSMKVWDLARGWTLRTIYGVGRRVYGVRFALGDRRIVTSEPRSLRMWDPSSDGDGGECVRIFTGYEDPAAVVLALGGTLLAAIFHGSSYLRVWNLEGDIEVPTETVVTEETGRRPHKGRTTVVSETASGSRILFAFRDCHVATAYDLTEGTVVRRMRLPETGAITALVIAREYFVCAARYRDTRTMDRVRLEVFDGETGRHIRSVKACGWDTIHDLHLNAIGSHLVTFCRNRRSGSSYVATWNIETEDHRHVARQSAGSCLVGAVGDLRYLVTAADRSTEARVWNLKAVVEAKAARERPPLGVTRILPMINHPQYVVSTGNDGRVEVWNVGMNDFCGEGVYQSPTLTQSEDDLVLLFDVHLIILGNREYSKAEDETDPGVILVYTTIRSFDLSLGQWISVSEGCFVPVFPVKDYALLSENELLGLSESRSHFVIWEVSSGSVVSRIRIPFRDQELTSEPEQLSSGCDSPSTEQPTAGRTASSAKMTPWTRRRETKTARRQRHRRDAEEDRRRRAKRRSERHNAVDEYRVSADRKTVVASFFGHHLCVFDVESRRQMGVLQSDSSAMHLTVSTLTADGRLLVLAGYDDAVREARVSMWDVVSGECLGFVGHNSWANAIAVDETGSRIVFCTQNNSNRNRNSSKDRNAVCIWQPTSVCAPFREVEGHRNFNAADDIEAVIRLTAGEGGGSRRRAVVLAGDISVWDLDDAVLLCIFTPDAKIQCMELGLDGQLVTVGFDNVPGIVTLKMVSNRTQDAIKYSSVSTPCLFGENPEEFIERNAMEEDFSDKKIRINPGLFFQNGNEN